MNAHQGICYLHPRLAPPSPLEDKVKSLLQAFGGLTHFEVLRRSPRWEMLIEFDSLDSLELAADTLKQSKSEVGLLTVLALPVGTPKSQACTDQASATVSKNLGSGPKSPAERGSNLSGGASDEPGNFKFEPLGNQPPSGDQIRRSFGDSESLSIRPQLLSTILSRSPLATQESPKVSKPSGFFRTFHEYPTTDTELPLPLPGRYQYLLLKNLSLTTCKLSCVLNLLGAFGNATNYLIDKKREWGAFGFTTDDRIDAFVTCIQGQLFFGSHLICSKISSDTDLGLITDADNERYIVGAENKKNHRYQQNLVIKFNPPSRLLHVTNVAEHIDQQRLYLLFAKYHEPVRIMKLRQRSATASEMFLAEFDQPHRAIEILSLFHNTNVADRSVKVSFSHTKVDGSAGRSLNI